MNQMLKTIMMVLLFILIALLPACRKSENKKECPLKSYNIECEERTWDLVFGGYNTVIHQYSIQSNCPEDAQKAAADMSYNLGGAYTQCHVVP